MESYHVDKCRGMNSNKRLITNKNGDDHDNGIKLIINRVKKIELNVAMKADDDNIICICKRDGSSSVCNGKGYNYFKIRHFCYKYQIG